MTEGERLKEKEKHWVCVTVGRRRTMEVLTVWHHKLIKSVLVAEKRTSIVIVVWNSQSIQRHGACGQLEGRGRDKHGYQRM